MATPSDFNCKLREAGLDDTYWANIFKKHLDVTSLSQLKYAKLDDFEKVKPFARQSWEVHALKDILNVSDESSKRTAESSSRQKKARGLVEELRTLNESGKTRTDEQVKLKEKHLRAVLDNTSDEWIEEGDSTSLQSVISRYDNFLSGTNTLLSREKELTCSELLETASGGLALSGVLVLETLESKRIVLKTPGNVKIRNPEMTQCDKLQENTSKKQSDRFLHILDTVGYSVAASAEGSYLGAHAETANAYKREGEEEKKVQSHEQGTFLSQVKYSIVPTASCELSQNELQLSQSALQDLRAIEKLLVAGNDLEGAYQACEGFFNTYGSHVNAGLLHFGGISQFIASYSSESQSQVSSVRSLVNSALNTSVNVAYKKPLAGGGVSLAGGSEETSGSLSNENTELEQSKVQIINKRTGGPQEVTDIHLWKRGLVENNRTWALIDRGKSLSSDFVGIWDLLPNHDEFKKAATLASTLRNVWRKLSGQADATQFNIDELEKRVEAFFSDPQFPDRCADILKTMFETFEQVQGETKATSHWMSKMRKAGPFCDFFVQLVENSHRLSPDETPMVRHWAKKLMESADFKDFNGRDKVRMWLRDSEADTLDSVPKLTTVKDFISAIKEQVLPKLWKEESDGASSNTTATAAVALWVNTLLKTLSSEQEVLFLHANLLELHFDARHKTFRTRLTLAKLQDFVEKCEARWQELESILVKGKAQSEAFLVYLVVISDYFQKDLQEKEDEFNEIVKNIRKTGSKEVTQLLNKFATCPFQWEKLRDIAEKVARGDMVCLEETPLLLPELEKVLIPESVSAVAQREKPNEKHPLKLTEAFDETLSKLDLIRDYPGKISLQQATEVRPCPRNIRTCHLPWTFMERLMTLDSHARDGFTLDMQAADTEEYSFGFGFGLENSGDEANGSRTLPMHPMDMLLATFSSCDGILQQVIAQNLFSCKLAIPFIYPVGSQDNLFFSLWALRTIVVRCSANNDVIETSATDYPLNFLTFVRLGRPSASKSKLLNDVILDATHDTFYSSNCHCKTEERSIADGMVECSWYLPASKKDDILPNATFLLNLRGNACTYPIQMDLLNRISSVIVVQVNVEDIATTTCVDTLANICASGEKIVLVLTTTSESPDMKMAKHELQKCAAHIGKNTSQGIKQVVTFTKDGQLNAHEVKSKLRVLLPNLLAESCAISVEEAAKIAKANGVRLDEQQSACLAGKLRAEKVMKSIGQTDIIDCKKHLLPLQGKPWLEYSTLLKKHHREGCRNTSSASQNQLQQDMLDLRRKQAELCQSLTPFFSTFLNCLLGSGRDQIKVFFLQWLKLLMDAKSRLHLSRLHREYCDIWDKFQEAKTAHNEVEMAKMRKHVLVAEQNIADASFGLENIFREIGQLFDALHDSITPLKREITENLKRLPETVAKLLLTGNPLELVDGDASSVSVTWIKAVLAKLEGMIGNKRLFVISVLGVQSSGKSTLLNTMFGLKFAVSAGRCTRGAFMQVIKVDRPDLPMGYIAVIDTEGLRAPELAQLKYHHDNELATLAIGLGHVTLINIKGENAAEMKDVLQIAVHAFMRMKIVNMNLNIHRTCIFIHQNVPAVDAKEKMMQGCQKLQEQLDFMTEEAAESEGIRDIHSFSEIIQFDIHKHVYYFVDLWHGNPPMAPVNLGYSENVQDVRKCLLEKLAKGQNMYLTISDFSSRIQDLWYGVLADDFVFSFRNSLELKAYHSLEGKYGSLKWELGKCVMNWIQATAEIKIRKCETTDELEKCYQSMLGELRMMVDEKTSDLQKSLAEVFKDGDLQDIMIQWKQGKFNALKLDSQQHHNEGKRHLLEVKEAWRIQLLSQGEWIRRKDIFMKKAVKLADQLKGKNATDDELQDEFDSMWMPLVNELVPEESSQRIKVDKLMKDLLEDIFFADKPVLRKHLEIQPLDHPFAHQSLVNSITLETVEEEDLTFHQSWKDKIPGQFSKNAQKARIGTIDKTGEILNVIDCHLDNLCTENTKFQRAHADHVIKMLKQGFEHFNRDESKAQRFSITPRYIVKLAVHVSRYCVQVFTKMQDDYEKTQGIAMKLKSYKEKSWILFSNTVKQSTKEVIAADLFCDELKDVVEQTVARAVPPKIVERIVNDFSFIKYHLILKIMDDLAMKGDFKNHMRYVKDAKTFATKWIRRYTDTKMFSTSQKQPVSRYGEITRTHVQKIIRCIEKGVDNASTAVRQSAENKMGVWMETFCDQVEDEIPITRSDLKQFGEENIQDLAHLQKLILAQLESLESRLIKQFNGFTAESVNWERPTPYQRIIDELWGCPAQCPFCGEPCHLNTSDHFYQSGQAHSCLQHRPAGVNGTWLKEKLCVETCGYDVQSKSQFGCAFHQKQGQKCSSKSGYHDYRAYKTTFPEWDIAPDSTNTASKYWGWFMTTYQHQLVEYYYPDVKLPSIPPAWKLITKEQALESLRKYQ